VTQLQESPTLSKALRFAGGLDHACPLHGGRTAYLTQRLKGAACRSRPDLPNHFGSTDLLRASCPHNNAPCGYQVQSDTVCVVGCGLHGPWNETVVVVVAGMLIFIGEENLQAANAPAIID
jgi:hypothetical protein